MSSDQRISLQKLEVLCLVVELGGVHRAAERLLVTQPVISAHLHSLQERFGTRLFVKHGRRIALSEAGEAVYAWAKEVLAGRAALDRKIEDLSCGDAGTVRVAASMSVGDYHLRTPLVDFARSHPNARITLLASDPDAALRNVEEGTCDFGLIVTDAPISRDIHHVKQVGWDVTTLIAAPDSDLPNVIEAATLATQQAVCPPSDSAARRLEDAVLRAVGVRNRPVVIECDTVETIKGAVAAGLGVALMSREAVRAELARGELREISVLGMRMDRPLFHVQRHDRQLSLMQQAFSDTIRTSLSRLNGGIDRHAPSRTPRAVPSCGSRDADRRAVDELSDVLTGA